MNKEELCNILLKFYHANGEDHTRVARSKIMDGWESLESLVLAGQVEISQLKAEIAERKQENAGMVHENLALQDTIDQMTNALPIDWSEPGGVVRIPMGEKRWATCTFKVKPRLPIWRVYRQDGVLAFQYAEDEQEWHDLIHACQVSADHVRFCIERLGYKVKCE